MNPRILIVPLIVLIGGCNEPFEPKGDISEQLVVYAVLTSVNDVQYIRLYRTYDPPAFDPLEYTTDNSLVGADVTISDGAVMYRFRDTSIAREDKSRYKDDIRAYVASPFVLERGKTYTLDIKAQSGEEVHSQLAVPGLASVSIGNIFAFQYPSAFRDEFIFLTSALSSSTMGFQYHAYLEYDLLQNGVWVPQREELPTVVRDVSDCLNFLPNYHQLERRKAVQPQLTTFDVRAFRAMLAKVWNTYSVFTVRMRRVVFELTEFDTNLYTYLSLANGFRDEFSIRTDEPDYSNITGGNGVFGAMVQQSISVALADTVGKTIKCNDL